MIVKLLTEHHLEFLSLKGGCRGSSCQNVKLFEISCRGSFINLQVVAVLMGFVGILLMVLVIGASSWVHVSGYREGLWDRCYESGPGRITCQGGESKRKYFIGYIFFGIIQGFPQNVQRSQ